MREDVSKYLYFGNLSEFFCEILALINILDDICSWKYHPCKGCTWWTAIFFDATVSSGDLIT
jgi:hypothetical protein